MAVGSIGSSTTANLYQVLQGTKPATTTSAKDKDGDNDAGNEAAEKSGKIDIKG